MNKTFKVIIQVQLYLIHSLIPSYSDIGGKEPFQVQDVPESPE